MANEIYTNLRAKGVGTIFDENFKTDEVVLVKEAKEDFVQILTKWRTPFDAIAKISAKIGNVDLIHFWCDNDSYGNDKYENIWNDGKMIKSYVYPFNFDKEDYDDKIEVETTDKFNITSEEDERDL